MAPVWIWKIRRSNQHLKVPGEQPSQSDHMATLKEGVLLLIRTRPDKAKRAKNEQIATDERDTIEGKAMLEKAH